MNRRQIILGGLVALVAGLNVWHWWPSATPTKGEARLTASPSLSSTQELRVRIATEAEKSPAPRRDLFQPRIVVAKVAPAPKIAAPAEPPPKTPEQLAEEAARAELAQIKLVGVVFRGDKGEAFVVKGDQTYTVRVGEKVGERFTVDAVSTDGISLKDPTTQVSGKIAVSGK